MDGFGFCGDDDWAGYEPGYAPLCLLNDDAPGGWDEPVGLGETPVVVYHPAPCPPPVASSSAVEVPADKPPVPVSEAHEFPAVVVESLPELEPALPDLPAPPEPPLNVHFRESLHRLAQARRKMRAGDTEGSLQEYQVLIRAHAELEAVRGDLTRLLGQTPHEKHVIAHCLLGDTLMRQGQINAALKIYRKALVLLR